ncbi:hypothetical protein, partial [Treponema endosymbiont of Eucomonympha sp.]|uniref:hypothetical protein n=1 Tax=Treponema endosymbiont of Eucomonympha sp. TaxID=1580831 RepID=UPI001EE73899
KHKKERGNPLLFAARRFCSGFTGIWEEGFRQARFRRIPYANLASAKRYLFLLLRIFCNNSLY